MKPVLMHYLRCPECKSSLQIEVYEQRPVTLTEAEREVIQRRQFDPAAYETEVMRGALTCQACNATFPIVAGVPRLYKGAEKDLPLAENSNLTTENLKRQKSVQHVQASFSREWDEFDYGDQTIWHWTLDDRIRTFSEEIRVTNLAELKGRLMVDAGCGTGILSMTLAQRYLVEIIAFDMAFIVGRAFATNKSNLCHFVQGSVLAPPFMSAFTDITYSNGCLHHTYSTKLAFDAISKLTKPGGFLYVWLYGKKRGWNRIKYILIDSLRVPIACLPHRLQTVVIYLLVGFHMVTRALKQLVGMKVSDIQSIRQFLVVVRDRYTPRYAREHREEEVIGWFTANGYKNVSRRTSWEHTKPWHESTDLSIKGVRG